MSRHRLVPAQWQSSKHFKVSGVWEGSRHRLPWAAGLFGATWRSSSTPLGPFTVAPAGKAPSSPHVPGHRGSEGLPADPGVCSRVDDGHVCSAAKESGTRRADRVVSVHTHTPAFMRAHKTQTAFSDFV
nr:hypothetical protein HJG59_011079 [Molossus molossus]